MNKFFYNAVAVVLLSLLIFTPTVFGQSTLGTGVTVSMDPQMPAPGQMVTIMVESFSTDLNQATFTWLVNGVVKKQGKAIKTFTLTAGAVGSTQMVEVDIDTKDIGNVAKRLVVAPAGVEVIEQADSSVPPFYKGKALSSPQGQVILIALPTLVTQSGRRLSSAEIVFTWKQNGKVLGDKSGLGKDTLSVTTPFIAEQILEINVEASSPENNLYATKKYFIQTGTPKIIFYENSPLLGILSNRALKNSYTLTKDEITITAYPFFFAPSVLNDPATNFNWSINGSPVEPTGASRNILTLRKPGGVSGISIVSLSLQNIKRVFESASQSLQVGFGESNSNVTF